MEESQTEAGREMDDIAGLNHALCPGESIHSPVHKSV